MRSKVLPVALLLLFGVAHASVVWGPTSRDEATRINGAGDPLAPAGATVALSANAVGTQGFVGAMTAVDASAFRGRNVELVAYLRVLEGEAPAALWLRADGPDGRLAFSTTAKRPVIAADGLKEQSVRLCIPIAARSLKLGTTLQGTGSLEAAFFRFTAVDAPLGNAMAHEVLDKAISTMQVAALSALAAVATFLNYILIEKLEATDEDFAVLLLPRFEVAHITMPAVYTELADDINALAADGIDFGFLKI